MSMFFYLLVAASFGWIASQLSPGRPRLLKNIAAAVLGALLAGFLLTPWLNVGSIDKAMAIPVPLLGSLLLLAILQLIRI